MMAAELAPRCELAATRLLAAVADGRPLRASVPFEPR
jgi:hypothetical protein